MSVTVCSEIVDPDRLILRAVDNDREDLDVARLIPWIFRQTGLNLSKMTAPRIGHKKK
ncbi:hypothetical protein BDV39DRAFT_198816 [Aspergillus sergii]|uniref:Uncharacterized protein n=1 Tax=Aspergillus sergii TaxID=1034303 RepID=A0A5N6XNG0_9EURO|nr:hypothetical protein BDV39DRAFT_198816 [Aspergillus sergii]